jgi:hypothetical protein
MIRSFPPHPNPLPCLRRSGFAQAGPRGEGRPFIPPAELGGILAYFDKIDQPNKLNRSKNMRHLIKKRNFWIILSIDIFLL